MEWLSESRRWNQIERFPVQILLGAQPNLGTQSHFVTPGDLRVEL